MAGKMLACLERSFSVRNTGIHIKGRDYYDLLRIVRGDDPGTTTGSHLIVNCNKKMLYDNAQLSRVYLHTWLVTSNPFY